LISFRSAFHLLAEVLFKCLLSGEMFMTTALPRHYRGKTARETQELLSEHTRAMYAALAQMLGGSCTAEQIRNDIHYQLNQGESPEKAAEIIWKKYNPPQVLHD
jgi:hypothetical protein